MSLTSRGSVGPKTVVEYAVQILKEEGEFLHRASLAQRILDAGYPSRAAKPVSSVLTCLNDEIGKSTPRLSKIGDAYGLPYWNWAPVKVPPARK